MGIKISEDKFWRDINIQILSDLSTMTCPFWVAPRAWLSFIELDKSAVLKESKLEKKK